MRPTTSTSATATAGTAGTHSKVVAGTISKGSKDGRALHGSSLTVRLNESDAFVDGAHNGIGLLGGSALGGTNGDRTLLSNGALGSSNSLRGGALDGSNSGSNMLGDGALDGSGNTLGDGAYASSNLVGYGALGRSKPLGDGALGGSNPFGHSALNSSDLFGDGVLDDCGCSTPNGSDVFTTRRANNSGGHRHSGRCARTVVAWRQTAGDWG